MIFSYLTVQSNRISILQKNALVQHALLLAITPESLQEDELRHERAVQACHNCYELFLPWLLF